MKDILLFIFIIWTIYGLYEFITNPEARKDAEPKPPPPPEDCSDIRGKLYDTGNYDSFALQIKPCYEIKELYSQLSSKKREEEERREEEEGWKEIAKQKEYMKSPKWKRKRQKRLDIDGHRCVLCDTKSNLNIHHTTYSNFRNEEMEDLRTLCRDCHNSVHEQFGYPNSIYSDDWFSTYWEDDWDRN